MIAIRLAAIVLATAFTCNYIAADEVITMTYKNGKTEQVKVNDIADISFDAVKGLQDGHQWVDLGLPSGTKWATCNVGGEHPGDYGDYFAWGGIETKHNFSPADPQWYNLSEATLREKGVIDENGNLTLLHDAAFQNWGGTWRMPTKDDISELINYCSFDWGTLDGHFGTFVTGPNGNSIFLPASGFRKGDNCEQTIYSGRYWSSTVLPNNTYYSYYLYSNNYGELYDTDRYYGFTVRPVSNNPEGPSIERPEAIEVSVYVGNIVEVEWSTVEGAVSYNVLRGHTVREMQKIATATTNMYLDESPLPGTNVYCIEAVGANGIISPMSPSTEPVFIDVSEDIDGHKVIDLGLPSGVKWATCNVGAKTPADYGAFFAWGETEIKSSYNQDSYKWDGYSLASLMENGVIDADGNLTAAYDAATASWGSSYRMPTSDEINELIDNCTWKLSAQNGTPGALATGPNGCTLFFPFAGFMWDTGIRGLGDEANFWGSTIIVDSYSDAGYCYISSKGMWDYCSRFIGLSVRPVYRPIDL